jgi:hypothetical protein
MASLQTLILLPDDCGFLAACRRRGEGASVCATSHAPGCFLPSARPSSEACLVMQ